MQKPLFHFSKDERLCRKKIIDSLFVDGKSFIKFPLRITYQFIKKEQAVNPAIPDITSPVQVMFSVPKKRFKRANKRNLYKRRMREAYRLNKHFLYSQIHLENHLLAVSIVYLPTEDKPYVEIENGMIQAIEKLIKISKHHPLQDDVK